MGTWIFQANPDQFDIDSFLATRPRDFRWLVKQHAGEIIAGDRVFVWRSSGEKKAVSGIIAESTVLSPAMPRAESREAVPFWRAGRPEANDIRPRALLLLGRVALEREMLRSDQLKQEPLLQNVGPLGFTQGTNYPVPAEQEERLAALWGS